MAWPTPLISVVRRTRRRSAQTPAGETVLLPDLTGREAGYEPHDPVYLRQRSSLMATDQHSPTIRDMIGDVAPKLAELTEDVLFGDVWERPGLSKRDRSLITVATLVALNRTEQLPFHLVRALENGVTKEEIVESITHLAFYSGWPTAMSAIMLAKGVFKEHR
jgi:4-carboxymuconolactone decarboxylase